MIFGIEMEFNRLAHFGGQAVWLEKQAAIADVDAVNRGGGCGSTCGGGSRSHTGARGLVAACRAILRQG